MTENSQTGRLWNSVSDAWDVLDGPGRMSVEGFWAGMEQLVVQLIADLHRVGIDPLVEYAQSDIIKRWISYDLSDAKTELSIDEEILSIPTLQDTIESPSIKWRELVDYSIMDNKIVWGEGIEIPNRIVWAPRVRFQNDRVHATLGKPININLASIDWDSRVALRTLRCLWYCYQHGPTVRNIKSALNAILALPFMSHAGYVISVNSGKVKVRYGDSCYGSSDYAGHVVCGEPIASNISGTVLSDRRIIRFAEPVDNCKIQDWIIPSVSSEQPARKIINCHDVNSEDVPIIERETNGSTDATGTMMSGGGNWDGVDVGDILSISFPPSIEGTVRRIDGFLSDGTNRSGVYIQNPLPINIEDISYTVERAPWIELDGELKPGSYIFDIVEPSFDWLDNMWVGSKLIDFAGRTHAISSNLDSIIKCPEAAAPGPMRIVPNFLGDDDNEEFLILPQSSTPLEDGQYLYRFDPILDGIKIDGWQLDDRWSRWHPEILSLAEDGNRTSSVSISGHVYGILKGDVYTLEAEGENDIEVSVSSIGSRTSRTIMGSSKDITILTLDKNVPSNYSLSSMSRLIPSKRPVEGLNGFFVVKEGSTTGSTSSSGLEFYDNTASFESEVRVGDYIRLITDAGIEYRSVISSGDVISDTAMTINSVFPSGLSNAYYQIIKPYETEDFSSINIDVSPYEAQYYNRILTEEVLKNLNPNHVDYTFSDEAVEVINIANNPIESYGGEGGSAAQIREDGFDLEIENKEPVLIESTLNGSDILNMDFVLGPVVYQWIIEEYFSTTIEYDRTNNP